MKPYYLIFLLDEDGKYPEVIAGDSNRKYIEGVYDECREMYGKRVQLRIVEKSAAIWAVTRPAHRKLYLSAFLFKIGSSGVVKFLQEQTFREI